MASPIAYEKLKTLTPEGSTPESTARLLAYGSEPYAQRRARLNAIGWTDAALRNIAARLRTAGVRMPDGTVETAAAFIAAEGTPASAPKTAVNAPETAVIQQAGFPPTLWEMASRQAGYVTGEDGKRRRIALVRKPQAPDTDAISRLLASAMPEYRPMWPTESRTGAYCLCLADFQTGKAMEARGGTPALVSRVRDIIRQAVEAVAQERPEEAVIFELGDICEGNANHTSGSQLASNDLSQAEQLEVCARLLLEAVAALAPLVPRLRLVCVRSNHGEERRGGQTVGRGDFGIMTARIIAAALELAGPEWASRVTVHTQDALRTGIAVTVQGVKVAAFHGHYAKSEKNVASWVAQQAGGYGEDTAGECYRGAAVVLHGHFHHMYMMQTRGRLIVGCPSLEAGSAWVERAQGEYSEPGALALRLRSGRVRGVEMLTPAAGMAVDRKDPSTC